MKITIEGTPQEILEHMGHSAIGILGADDCDGPQEETTGYNPGAYHPEPAVPEEFRRKSPEERAERRARIAGAIGTLIEHADEIAGILSIFGVGLPTVVTNPDGSRYVIKPGG